MDQLQNAEGVARGQIDEMDLASAVRQFDMQRQTPSAHGHGLDARALGQGEAGPIEALKRQEGRKSPQRSGRLLNYCLLGDLLGDLIRSLAGPFDDGDDDNSDKNNDQQAKNDHDGLEYTEIGTYFFIHDRFT